MREMPGEGFTPKVQMNGHHVNCMDQDPRRAIDRLRDRCRDQPDISEADAEAVLSFSDRIDLLGSEYSDRRHAFFMKRLVNIAQNVGGLVDALEDRDAAEDIVRWIHAEYDNPETNKDYRTSLRMFGEHSTDGEGKPVSIEWVPSGYPSNYDPAPDPSDMLRWEEHILPMIGNRKYTDTGTELSSRQTGWHL